MREKNACSNAKISQTNSMFHIYLHTLKILEIRSINYNFEKNNSCVLGKKERPFTPIPFEKFHKQISSVSFEFMISLEINDKGSQFQGHWINKRK